MDEQLKNNLTSSKHWVRLLYMILFALALQLASIVMTALVVVQFLFALITGNDNAQLRQFGDSLSIFIFDTLQFLIYNSEEKPFPFADWPEPKVKVEKSGLAEEDAAEKKPKPKKAAAKRKAAPKKKAEPKPETEPAPEKEPEPEAEIKDEAESKDKNES